MANPNTIGCATFTAIFSLALGATASAGPYVAGNRAFPATPTTEDPFVADEFALSAKRMREGSTPSSPTIRETEFEAEIGKRLTESLGLSFEGGYEIKDPVGGTNDYGFENFKATLKYQFFKSAEHESLASFGVTREFGGTGAARVDADTVGATTPTFYFGKGFGDLGDRIAYLKPFAVTATLGYQIADRRSITRPDMIVAGGSIQYSLRYLEGNVRYIGLPEFIERLTPLVEFSYATPATNASGTATTGIIAPGVVYSGNHFDVGVEALIPATRTAGTNVGFIASLHWRFSGMLESVFFGDEE